MSGVETGPTTGAGPSEDSAKADKKSLRHKTEPASQNNGDLLTWCLSCEKATNKTVDLLLNAPSRAEEEDDYDPEDEDDYAQDDEDGEETEFSFSRPLSKKEKRLSADPALERSS